MSTTTDRIKTAIANQGQGAEKAQQKTIGDFLVTYKNEIQRALPAHLSADRLSRVALTECRKTPELLKCNAASLFGAIIQTAQLGLEPGGALGHTYLVPFKGEVQLILGYRGMIELARRSGQIISISARAVYAGDEFDYSYGTDEFIKHRPSPSAAQTPEQLVCVYAVAKLKDGGIQFEVLTKAQLNAIRVRSKASGNYSPWNTDYIEMSKKSAIRRLFKYLPVSIEAARATEIDESAESDDPPSHASIFQPIEALPNGTQFDSGTGEVVENVVSQ